jgi:hypothetical protein
MQGAGTAKGAADFIGADAFADVMHDDEAAREASRSRRRAWQRAAMARVSFSS